MLMYGNIPNGSGLSSSASVELLMGIILKDLFGYEELSMINLALIGQYGENNFNGMNCGIMDQFAIAMGKKEHAIFLDTQNLQYEYAPIHMNGYKIVIAASNKKRRLTDSKYNERRAECEEALKDILRLPDPLDQAMPEAEAWHIETTVSLSLRMKAGETGRQALLRLEQLLQSELTNLADHDITVETIEPVKLSR